MVENLVNGILTKQIDLGIIKEKDGALYRYGYLLVLELGINLFVATIIGIATGWLLQIAVFVIAFMPLRTYCGGYHASSFARCAVLSNVFILFSVSVVTLLHQNLSVTLLLGGIGLIAILQKAPCQSPAKPISQKEKIKYKKMIHLILGIEGAICLLLWNLNRELSGVILMAFFVMGFSVLVGTWKGEKT